jgi:hypothetical protein
VRTISNCARRGTTFQREADVVLTLQDGRVLDGFLRRFEHLLERERVLFEPWQVDEVFPQQRGA